MKRFPEQGKGWSRAVVCDGLVNAVAYDPNCSEGLVAQTQGALLHLEESLVAAGSHKGALVQVTIYLSEISNKPAMNEVWNAWIGGEENWPQRACVGVDLDTGYLIEIVATAKVKAAL